MTSAQANQIIRIFIGSTSHATLEPWALLPEVITTVLTRLFALVRDRANFWRVIASQPAEVKAMARERIGWLRLFNPSSPEPAYDIDLRVDEQRRFARMLLAMGRHIEKGTEEEGHGAVVEDSSKRTEGGDVLTVEALREADQEENKDILHRWNVSSAEIMSMEWVQEEAPSPSPSANAAAAKPALATLKRGGGFRCFTR